MDRTTVDALKALGKALCGDSFEVTPGLTDAEMIFEIAKQYEGGGSADLTFPVEIEEDQSAGTAICTTNFDDILEAIDVGKTIKLIEHTSSQGDHTMVLSGGCVHYAYDEAHSVFEIGITIIRAVTTTAAIVFSLGIERTGNVVMKSGTIPLTWNN